MSSRRCLPVSTLAAILPALLAATAHFSTIQGCKNSSAKPNCDKMRACCAALKGVENGLPKDQEILCERDPELDDGCIDTVKDIVRWTPARNLPAACK